MRDQPGSIDDARIASGGRLFLGSLVDGALLGGLAVAGFEILAGLWEAASGSPVSAPQIAFMGGYSKPAQNGYWMLVTLSIALALLLLPTLTPILGASPGKRLTGVRYLDGEGARAGLGRVYGKSLINTGLFLLLTIPGPALGFLFGPRANLLSLLFLVLGTAVVLALSLPIRGHRRSAVYRWSGLFPVVG